MSREIKKEERFKRGRECMTERESAGERWSVWHTHTEGERERERERERVREREGVCGTEERERVREREGVGDIDIV